MKLRERLLTGMLILGGAFAVASFISFLVMMGIGLAAVVSSLLG